MFVAAQPAMLAAIQTLLRDAGLPTSDLRADRLEHFLVNLDATGVARACVGLERAGSDALLRSLAIRVQDRGAGLGGHALDAIETRARQLGVTRLWLLTTTAKDFFLARGYTTCERADFPVAMQRTTEFALLCPASATCMTKSL